MGYVDGKTDTDLLLEEEGAEEDRERLAMLEVRGRGGRGEGGGREREGGGREGRREEGLEGGGSKGFFLLDPWILTLQEVSFKFNFYFHWYLSYKL